jgi:excisionase family DNA binding protein
VSLSAVEAAELVGVSKAAILKAVKTGRISATKDVKGVWRIDPAELMRVYRPVDYQVSAGTQTNNAESTDGLRREVEHLRELLAAKEETIAEENSAKSTRKPLMQTAAYKHQYA